MKVIGNATNALYYVVINETERSVKLIKKRRVHKPYNKLKGALRERGLTYSDVSKLLNISETAVGFKINGASDFYISEFIAMQKAYKIETDIFFTENSCEFDNNKKEGE